MPRAHSNVPSHRIWWLHSVRCVNIEDWARRTHQSYVLGRVYCKYTVFATRRRWERTRSKISRSRLTHVPRIYLYTLYISKLISAHWICLYYCLFFFGHSVVHSERLRWNHTHHDAARFVYLRRIAFFFSLSFTFGGELRSSNYSSSMCLWCMRPTLFVFILPFNSSSNWMVSFGCAD